MHLRSFLEDRVIVKVGDITEEKVDAIVNAANTTLFGGGGVDGAIHDKGGPAVLEECERIRDTEYPDGLPTGEAVITTAGKLPAKYVIHTVGPIFGRHSGKEQKLLRDSYINSISLAADRDLTSIAFPSISTGAYRYPKDEAASISSKAIAYFLSSNSSINEVRLVFFSRPDADTFLQHCSF